MVLLKCSDRCVFVPIGCLPQFSLIGAKWVGRERLINLGPLMTYYRQKVDYKVHMVERALGRAKVMRNRHFH